MYTNVWNDALPTGAEAANTIDDIFRSVKVDLEQRFIDIFNMANFTADPLRPGGLKFYDTADAKLFLGDNTGTPRGILLRDKADTTTYAQWLYTGLILSPPALTGASTPFLSVTQTWNNGATTFTGLLVSITSTASAAASLLFDFKVGGTSQLNLTKAGALTALGNVIAGSASTIGFNASTLLQAGSDGVLALSNNAGTGFNRLQFGGTTNAFPSLRRTGTALNFRLADDSGDAPFSGALFTGSNGITITSGTSAFQAVTATTTVNSGLITANAAISIKGATALNLYNVVNDAAMVINNTGGSGVNILTFGGGSYTFNGAISNTDNISIANGKSYTFTGGSSLTHPSGGSLSLVAVNLGGNGNITLNAASTFGVLIQVNSSTIGTFSATGLALNTLALSGVTNATLSGQIITTGGSGGGSAASVYMNATNPGLGWRASGGGVDEKFWDLLAGSNTMTFRTVNDSLGSAVNWLQVTRSGTAISSIALNGPITGVSSLGFTGSPAGPILTLSSVNFGNPVAANTAFGTETAISFFKTSNQALSMGLSGVAQMWLSIAGSSSSGFAIYTMNDNTTIPTKAFDITNTGNVTINKGSFTISSGAFQVGVAATVAVGVASTHEIAIKDSTGTTYQLLVHS